MLRFFAYVRESHWEAAPEGSIRRCVILYHLEDATLAINEHHQPGKGLPHVPILKRHKCATTPPNTSAIITSHAQLYMCGQDGMQAAKQSSGASQLVLTLRVCACRSSVQLKELNVGNSLTLFCRTYHIIGADSFTRRCAPPQPVDQHLWLSLGHLTSDERRNSLQKCGRRWAGMSNWITVWG